MELRDAYTIAGDSLKEYMCDRRMLLTIAVYLVIMLFGAAKSSQIADGFGFILGMIFGQGARVPYALLFFYGISMVLLPVFALLTSYSVIAGDASSGAMRAIAANTSRSSIIIGRLAAVFAVVAATNLAAFFIAGIYVYFTSGVFYSDSLSSLAAYLLFYAFFFCSLGVLASSIAKTAAKALFLGALLYALPMLFHLKASLSWLSPYHYYANGYYILAGQEAAASNALLMFIVSGILFAAAAILIFNRRDL